MNGYTKLIDGNWATRTKQPDDSWLPIEKDESGVITAPQGLVDQIALDVQAKFRNDRDNLLKEVDLYQLVLRWNSLTSEQQTDLTNYRQALLDATIDWVMPEKPNWM